MRGQGKHRGGERGATTLEFALAASIYFMLLFSITAGGVYFWAHNGLVEATRRGARHAATVGTSAAAKTEIRNMAVYGNTGGTGTSIAPKLLPENIAVRRSDDFGVNKGTVSVGICTAAADDDDGDCTPYTFDFIIPGISLPNMAMPAYWTTAAGESAGFSP